MSPVWRINSSAAVESFRNAGRDGSISIMLVSSAPSGTSVLAKVLSMRAFGGRLCGGEIVRAGENVNSLSATLIMRSTSGAGIKLGLDCQEGAAISQKS